MREMLINNRSYKNDRAGYDIGGKSGTAKVVRNGAYDDSFAELVGSRLQLPQPFTIKIKEVKTLMSKQITLML